MNLTETISSLARLSVADRMRVVEEIWDSIPSEGEFPEIDPSVKAEWKRRGDELDANPSSALTWDEIKASLKINRQ